IYTVTLSAGVAPATGEETAAAHTFSFETAPAPDQNRSGGNVSLRFSQQLVEFPTFAAPTVNFWLGYNRGARPVINVNVYALGSREAGIDAANRLANLPSWAWGMGFDSNQVDVSGLRSVYSARIASREADRWNETFAMSTTLPPGFYVLHAEAGGSTGQVIIQITDLAVQVIADDDKALVWVNHMTDGQPAAATVYDPAEDKIYETTDYGIAVIDRPLSEGEHLVVAAGDMESVVFINAGAFQRFHGGWDHWDMVRVDMDWGMPSPWFGGANGNSRYWTALQLDRTLFQRSDTLSLWGFVQSRQQASGQNQAENITFVTATITEQSWWHSPDNDTLVRQNIPVSYGAYSGDIRLPHLDPGFYELAISHGDMVLSSVFFSVQDYVKPPYQLTVSADKAAIFLGESVTFTARTEFFEGTPVPDLRLSYQSWGGDLTTPSGSRGTTDASGMVTRTITPTPWNNASQGPTQLQFSAEATLPEIGWSHAFASTRVFINDIHVRPQATREGSAATLSVNVHNITTDRINDGTAAHWGDFLDTPVEGQTLNVEIHRVFWVPIREGERYDFVTRQVVPRYRHERRTERIQQFSLTTDAEGYAGRDFTVPNRENESYEARITTTDGNGRTITHTVFIGRDWTGFFNNSDSDAPFLEGARPLNIGYDIGDPVELTIMSGTEPITRGNFLFVVVQDGIMSYHIGENTLAFTFDETHVPNTTVFAYHFNGHTYQSGGQMSRRLRFNPASREMILSVTTCQETYRPGDMSTITVTATDLAGNPLAANVNISLVDEALFALMDQQVDTLADLYRMVDDSLRFSLATHRTFVSSGLREEEMLYGAQVMADSAAGAPVPTAEAAWDGAARGSTAATIRQHFEDTATFKSLRTGEDGTASFTFQLPDNITAWRLTASGISNTLLAGTTVQNIPVTNPMFVHYTLASTFLVGDMPYIGVNAFGTALAGGQVVTFEVWCESNPDNVRTATGAAFERVNIPLWEMTAEGQYALVVQATAAGYSDAVRHTYQVINSHRTVDTAVFYEVTPSTVFDINPQGLTNITFTDRGRGQFLSTLTALRWNRGARIEGLVVRREATRLIQTYFPDTPLFNTGDAFDPRDYQVESGGIAMLPYADANLQTTVMLLPFIRHEVNAHAVAAYLRSMATDGAQDNRMLALYGLAVLGEPVLLELQTIAQLEDLSVRNAAYVGLGLAALGETAAAEVLFAAHIAPHIQRVMPYYRVNVGNNREILDATSAAALLAVQLGLPQAAGMHNYVVRNHTENPLLNIERLAFIIHAMAQAADTPASITYTLLGEEITRDLSGWQQFTLRIPAENFDEFNITSVTGQVGAVSIVRTPLEDIEPVENSMTIRREFFAAGSTTPSTTFAQDDLVRVQLTINYGTEAVSGSYIITDFLPAGLALVENSARFGGDGTVSQNWRHATAEGQRVTFYDFNGRFRVNTYYYYARVVNPGTFTAEGTMVQSVGAREYMTLGESAVIMVR
ncbi:MAG: hypothetical protein FWG38_05640, partial [Defluviitaleaceae bacterium]|nr:hypothetical protein [Defluviitaleaceae bacterium]